MNQQARLAWTRAQLAFEKRFLQRAKEPVMRLDFAKEHLGADALSLSQKQARKMVDQLEKTVDVRERYLKRHQLMTGMDEKGFASDDRNLPLVATGGWARRLGEARGALESTEGLPRDVVRRTLLRAFREGRQSPVDGRRELANAEQAIRDALKDSRQELIKNLPSSIRVTSESGPEYNRVKHIVDKVASVAPGSPMTERVVLIQDPRLQAFSAGANQFGVHDGLAGALADDPAALAWVLAHEIAHDRHRDLPGQTKVLERYKAMAKVRNVITRAPSFADEVLSATQDWMRKIQLMREAQADADGVRLAARAGFDPEGSVRALERLKDPAKTDAVYEKNGYWPPARRQEALRRIIKAERLGSGLATSG